MIRAATGTPPTQDERRRSAKLTRHQLADARALLDAGTETCTGVARLRALAADEY